MTLVAELIALRANINIRFVLIVFNGVASVTAHLHGCMHRGALELCFMTLLATIEVESTSIGRAGDSRMWGLRQPIIGENGQQQ